MANNLSQLKKALTAGAEFEIVGHRRPECVGQRRRVNVANTAGFYSIIPDEPDSKTTLANGGKGSFLGWSKARFWRFENGVCALYDDGEAQTPERLVIAIKLKEGAHGKPVQD